MGAHHPHANMAEAPTLTTLGGKVSSERAYEMAGLKPEDMDFAEIYDCFTITTLITLEDYGFCPKGEGGSWVQGGRIEIGGELPVNTHGGLLSQAHIEGMPHVTEAVKQLRAARSSPSARSRTRRSASSPATAAAPHPHDPDPGERASLIRNHNKPTPRPSPARARKREGALKEHQMATPAPYTKPLPKLEPDVRPYWDT